MHSNNASSEIAADVVQWWYKGPKGQYTPNRLRLRFLPAGTKRGTKSKADTREGYLKGFGSRPGGEASGQDVQPATDN